MKFGAAVTSEGVIVVAGGTLGSLVDSNEMYTSGDRGKMWKLLFSNAPWKGIMVVLLKNFTYTPASNPIFYKI